VNAGLACRETSKKLMEDLTKKVLLRVFFGMNGAIEGQFDRLSLEVLKFTL